MTVFELSHINFIASLGENCIALGSFVTCVTPVPGPTIPLVAMESLSQQTFHLSEKRKPLLLCSGGALLGDMGTVCSRKNRFTITASQSFNSKRGHAMEQFYRGDMRSRG